MYTIVVADDEKLERDAFRLIIERTCQDIDVVDARDGLEVISVAREVKADIVFMDLKMPGMNGIDAIEQLKKSLPDCRFVILTAYADFPSAQKGVKLGITDYLTKPARPEYVVDLVLRLIRDIDNEKQRQQREEELRIQIEKALPLIKMQFVQDLVLGGMTCSKVIYDRAALLGLSRMPQIAFVAGADEIENSDVSADEKVRQVARYAILEVLHSAVSEEEWILASFGLCDEIIILAPDCSTREQDSREWSIDFAERLRAAVESKTDTTVTIGVGRRVDRLEDIQRSYQDAREAKEYRFYLGGNRVIHIDDLFGSFVTTWMYPVQAEEELSGKVKLGDLDGALNVLTQMYQNTGVSGNREIWSTRTRAVQLLCSLCGFAFERSDSSDSLYEQNLRDIYRLLESKSFEGIKKILNESVTRLTGHIASVRIQRGKRVAAQVMDYIKEHYAEQIALEEVARTVFLSPNYLSYLFRSETSSTFSEYLTNYRIERAKALLALSDEPIRCIASKVGYCDGNYFSQVFKKIQGMSPSDYRTSMRKTSSKTVGL